MPAKGSNLQYGNKSPVFDRKVYTKLKKEFKDLNLSFDEVNDIFNSANALIAESIVKDPGGFKLPCKLGYVVVLKYLPKTRSEGFTTHNNKRVHSKFLNLHSFGNMFKFSHYKAVKSEMFISSFKFRVVRPLGRYLSRYVKETSGENFLTKPEINRIYLSLYKGSNFLKWA